MSLFASSSAFIIGIGQVCSGSGLGLFCLGSQRLTGGTMKAFLVSIALALFFSIGTASAGTGASQDGDHGSGCNHYDKWKDT
jgi:hypothetical protein